MTFNQWWQCLFNSLAGSVIEYIYIPWERIHTHLFVPSKSLKGFLWKFQKWLINFFHNKKTRKIPTEKNLSGNSDEIMTKICRKTISVNSLELRRYLVIRSRQNTYKIPTNIWPLQKIDTYRQTTDAIPTILVFRQTSVGIFRRDTDGFNSCRISRRNTDELCSR